ncbi:hypothetical protein B0J13DRAFT_627595 [Dactylonectria estremocensis]|uniref:Zn(2)-C6 fungal-type domain-containing protein n=1 Tax=Dactylonectria estremocensis TaxID=1079267 RepID=A0A9P9DZ58_9HYPO|nr:hypothetical protein B0J13DRAFT_627595 [Dactylonectria estremocensis]
MKNVTLSTGSRDTGKNARARESTDPRTLAYCTYTPWELSRTCVQPPPAPPSELSFADPMSFSFIGCYTCGLRRKKCDEGSPMCTACKHLGLQCEYKRPMWWSNNDMHRKHKDDVKTIIKRKKLSEKSSHSIQTSVGSSPPGVTHSMPTSATFTDPLNRNRSASIDSHFSAAFNFNSPPSGAEFGFNASMHPEIMFGSYPPYEIDVKTERQMFVNDVPTLRESHISTFSTYQPPPPAGTILSSVPFDGDCRQIDDQEIKSRVAQVRGSSECVRVD